jgi:hypothetical protein
MNHAQQTALVLGGGGLVGVALLATGAALAAARAAAPPAACCFTNPQFAGVCRVVPEADETCDSILAYLNNPNSTGKSYCDRTNIRGGWVQVGCDQESSAQAVHPAAVAGGSRSCGPAHPQC